MDLIKTLAEELKLKEEQVEKTVALLDDGNTIPFIARYRKEVTGSLDDVTLRALSDRLTYLRHLDERREEIRTLIDGQEKLTPELASQIDAAKTLVELEDIYRPYRPKRRTRASIAKERGLEPLAELILSQPDAFDPTLEAVAAEYIGDEVPDAAAAIAGASDILAEVFADDADLRRALRAYANENATLTSKQNKEGDSVYAQYYDFSEPLKKLRHHRVLALNRGEREEYLKVALEMPEEGALAEMGAQIIKNKQSAAVPTLIEVIADSYRRLILPSLEREIRSSLFDDAAEAALAVFTDNLRHLLMGAPLKGKTVLGYDPGYRTGCKLAVVDRTGKVLDTAVIYPTKPREDIQGATKTVRRLIDKHGVDVVAIGNGTASRESEQFIAGVIRALNEENYPRDVKYTIVSESGASVYSASKLAQDEFPDFDVTERSAVSIARRLQDPLAELVKIDPKSIGVGQYQHDMKPARLDEALGGVVEDCVNAVGVDLNTASHSLLSYLAGISSAAAKNIVLYREENGEFKKRADVKKVSKIGEKAYQQCAGFLRVPGSSEILDNTGVHPESYEAAQALLSKFGYTEADVAGGLKALRLQVSKYGAERLANELSIGLPTLTDIVGELEKPGRDVRDTLPPPELRSDVLSIEDLQPDMLLKGTVRNVVDFGAFVDIGVHEDGLLHVSEICRRFIRHPSEALSVGDVIEVRVKSVDVQRKRISLTRKGTADFK
ncbi:MAG: RNA-binding transcriptional accessory protein [Clostridia bacterium]|nr:RNA-binding transcriptional accessory protein [Clostridia bacterium]